MDIKTLLRNLREEVSCPVCTNVYTDPKHLPCLHTFCLHCLKHWHTTSHGRDTIRCPKCQAISRVPDSGDLTDLPTSFYLNGLIDVLAIKECKTSQVRCGNCDKKSAESSYCFHCCVFWCDECIIGHNIIRSNKDHRVLALKDFQDKDYEDVMKRPAFCPKEDHNKEELKYFCKDCETPLCQICVTLDHGGHNMKLIKEEAERQRTEMKSFVKKQRHNLQAKMNAVSRLDRECATLIQQGEDVKREIQTFVDNLIAIIEANKKNIFAEVEKEINKSIERIIRRKTEIERQMTAIKSFLEKAEKLFTRSTNAEIVQLKKSSDTIFEGVHQIESTDCNPELVAHFVFVENHKLFHNVKTEEIGTLKKPTKAGHCDIEGKGLEGGIALREAHFTLTTKDTEGRQCYNEGDHVTVEIRDEQGRECTSEIQINDCKDGLYQVRYCPRHPVKCQVTVKVNGEHVSDSPFAVQVTPFQFKPVFSFGKEGSSEGKFRFPWGVAVNAVNAKDEIVVTDYLNHRVQIFNSVGNYLRSFGRSATKEREFKFPVGIIYHNNGNIFVADYGNSRIQIFKGKGEYVGSFGGRGSLDSQLSGPYGLSVDSDGNIIVADSGNRLIKIFSPDGNFLTKIGGQGSLTSPVHCIQYERYLIVSDCGEHCIKVFDRKGNFQYKFGKKGGGDGELNCPRSLLVNKSGHLMVGDENNHRIQVFELNGKFLGKFGIKGGNLGEFNSPAFLAVLSNGQIVVCDVCNHRIQILE